MIGDSTNFKKHLNLDYEIKDNFKKLSLIEEKYTVRNKIGPMTLD